MNFLTIAIMISIFAKSCRSFRIGSARFPATYAAVRPMAMSIIENPLSLVQPLLRPATTDLMKLMSRYLSAYSDILDITKHLCMVYRWDDLMWPQTGMSGLHMDIKETKTHYEVNL